METTLKELTEKFATKEDLKRTEKIAKALRKPYQLHKEENLQKLYEYASIVISQIGKHPYGEVTRISIKDNYGSIINIEITKNNNNEKQGIN